MPDLHVFQALWAMEQRRPGMPEPAVAEKFDRVAEAGFDGMAIDLGALTLAQARETVPHFARTGLRGLVTAFPRSIEELRPALLLARSIEAPFVVVVGQVMPLAVADMIPVVRDWQRLADDEGMPIQFETHRNCITNDLFATIQLLDAIPEMRLSADLSHYVVDREMPCPPPPELQALIGRVLAGASAPISVTVDVKDGYDADDMKVWRDGDRLVRIGKLLAPDECNAESIGLLAFRGEGPAIFVGAVERIMHTPEGTQSWYLRVIDGIAGSGVVGTVSIRGERWQEVDYLTDMEAARALTADWAAAGH